MEPFLITAIVTFAVVMVIFGIACGVALAKAPYRNK